jgi:hypothetical protein
MDTTFSGFAESFHTRLEGDLSAALTGDRSSSECVQAVFGS